MSNRRTKPEEAGYASASAKSPLFEFKDNHQTITAQSGESTNSWMPLIGDDS